MASLPASAAETVFYNSNPACLSASHCLVPVEVTTAPGNGAAAYTPLATLVLPPGQYHVTGKLSAYWQGNLVASEFRQAECVIYKPAANGNAVFDYSSFTGLSEQTVPLQGVIRISQLAGPTTVSLGCRANVMTPGAASELVVWNASLFAGVISRLFVQ